MKTEKLDALKSDSKMPPISKLGRTIGAVEEDTGTTGYYVA